MNRSEIKINLRSKPVAVIVRRLRCILIIAVFPLLTSYHFMPVEQALRNSQDCIDLGDDI